MRCREQLWLFRRTRLRWAEGLGEMGIRFEFAGKYPHDAMWLCGTVITVPYNMIL